MNVKKNRCTEGPTGYLPTKKHPKPSDILCNGGFLTTLEPLLTTKQIESSDYKRFKNTPMCNMRAARYPRTKHRVGIPRIVSEVRCTLCNGIPQVIQPFEVQRYNKAMKIINI